MENEGDGVKNVGKSAILSLTNDPLTDTEMAFAFATKLKDEALRTHRKSHY